MASLLTLILVSANANASLVQFDVYANANSSNGGVGLNTGINVLAGDSISGFADPNDLWSAGPLPRWSNADGLIGDIYATGTDDSGGAAGSLIGQSFGPLTQNGLTAAYGALVGEINNSFFLLGTNFNVAAPSSGVLSLYYWDSNAGDNSEFITVSVENGISTVPVPAAAWLFGSALLGFFGFARRKAS